VVNNVRIDAGIARNSHQRQDEIIVAELWALAGDTDGRREWIF